MTAGSGGGIVLPTTPTVPALPAIPTVPLPTVPLPTVPAADRAAADGAKRARRSDLIDSSYRPRLRIEPVTGIGVDSGVHDVESSNHDVDHAGRVPAKLSSPNH